MATKITVNNNGSLKIEGDFEIVDREGKPYGLQGRTVLGLCRCGKSANKPFCDGSHNGHFEHDAKAFDLPPKKSLANCRMAPSKLPFIKEPPGKVKPAISTDILAEVNPATLEEGCIYVHCRCANRGDDLLVRIWKTTYLIARGTGDKTQLLHAENITIAPQWLLVPKGVTHNFLLVFGTLPKSCTQFDLVEEIAQPGGFEIKNISRNETDVYHINIL